MPKSFKQDDVFPLINRFITDRSHRNSAFVEHAELVNAMLDDAEGREIVAAAEENSKFDKRNVAANMVAWFSQRYTMKKNAFRDLLEQKRIGTTWAYRSKQSKPTSAVSAADLVPDVDATAIEGNLKLVTHIKRERDPKLVKAKLAAVLAATGRLACECCGFDAKTTFAGIDYPIVEVHHRTMLSDYQVPSPTSSDDLSVLCPTCHRAIHRSGGLAVDEFRAKFFSTQ